MRRPHSRPRPAALAIVLLGLAALLAGSLLAGTALAPQIAAFAQSPAPVTFATAPLSIESAGGRHAFTVEMAVSEAQQQRGLMYRDSLAPDAGMLFDWGRERHSSMWMQNTLIPLDMLFIAGDGTIRHIVERTVPYSTASIPSRHPVRATLELAGGTFSRLGIRVGDRVRHPIFGTEP